MKLTKRGWLFLALCLGVIVIISAGGYFWFHRDQFNLIPTRWDTYSFGTGTEKNLAAIEYPSQYKDILSDNAKLPNQAVALFSIPNYMNFQLSNAARDKDIDSYIADMKNTAGQSSGETQTADLNYQTVKYGKNTIYLINEFNKSADFVVGEMFDGQGHRLNFTYHAKDVQAEEIKKLLEKIKF